MRYVTGAVGTAPAFRSYAGLHNLYCQVLQPFGTATVDFFQTVRYAQIGSLESYTFMSADEGTDTRYIGMGVNVSGGDLAQLRNRDDSQSFTGQWASDGVLLDDTAYVVNWRLVDGLDAMGSPMQAQRRAGRADQCTDRR